jgi:glycosyltransferase involved in cell wall biosynthesis
MKICHLTTAHPRNDVRIFEKECVSLASKYELCLFVADGQGFENIEGLKIHDIGFRKGRFNRFFVQLFRMLRYAFKTKANLYHFHDPELIFAGFILRLFGKKVIYDLHEDASKSLLGREWLPKWILILLASIYSLFENLFSRTFSGLIAATPAIAERFIKKNRNTIVIQNLPEISLKHHLKSDFKERTGICYTGAISQIRGIIPLLDALSYCNENIQLHLAGSFINSDIEEKVKAHFNFSRVIYYGQLKREELQKLYNLSFAGLVPFLPLPNHIEAQPNKFFEYMAAGLPVLCSDFPLWRSIVEKENIGLCFNPKNPEAIGQNIQKLYDSKNLVEEMGKNGISLIQNKYNWAVEKEKLFKFYGELLKSSGS